MSEKYIISVGELHASEAGSSLGQFSVSFMVEPPIVFNSREGIIELGDHTLNAINTLGKHFLQRTKHDEIQNNHALVTFSHELPDESATVGNISGRTDHRLTKDTIARALDLVLNTDTKKE